MNKIENIDIVSRLKKGDNDAYREIYENHYTVLCHLARNYLKDDFLARAIADEVIFHIWEVRESLVINSSLRGYLMRAVRNRCLNYLRDHSKEIGLACDLDPWNGPTSEISDNRHPLGILLEKELEVKLMEEIDSLPEQTGRIFKMSRFDDKRYLEIAKEMNISVNTVKYHIKKALSTLIKNLKKYF